MTAAALKLISGSRLWPWAAPGGGLVAEAFPMAQLRAWALPFIGYNGSQPEAFANRQRIAEAVNRFVRLGNFRGEVEESADALDAVLCAIAAIAVSTGRLASEPEAVAELEGWIPVCQPGPSLA